MKKFFLYLLIFLLIAGFATLAYGFWNAKKIRQWAVAAGEIEVKHNISSQEKNVEKRFGATGGKKAEELKNDLSGYTTDLENIYKETELARQETEKLGTPRAVRPVQKELLDYYIQSGEQVQSLLNVSKFMSKIFEITIFFDRIKQDMTIQDIQAIVTEAKTKSSEIDPGILPDEMQSSGNELKVATENYLDQFYQFAAGKVDTHDPLNSSYNDFSQKVNDFLAAKKKYSDTFQDIDSLANRIANDLAILERVRFSVK